VGFVFEQQSALNLQQFTEMNTQVSSEMLVSVMAVLHERLPCAQYYFRQRKLFKDRQIELYSISLKITPGDQNAEQAALTYA